ncbi:vanadium-dependent haloperoxidase [Hyphococcus flavus]|uniref:Vanadium-dependent haloperoxidase n=1 Tax=Hyphococcus flavus TaxID=1866326 RepID=A0AAF0CGV5_9PROT|nr:vanadium-dependent haloperoxidase [Hyphococcus flavus]WDI32698.1 vanadium-dependent haloperoxidase [Hyphococcus flavus]
MTKFFMILAAVGAITASTATLGARAEEPENEGAAKFSEVQKLGYLGRTSRSALTRSVLDRLRARKYHAENTLERLVMWHDVALDSVALDHTPDPDTGAVPFVQGGPTRTSRGLAMTQTAVFDALNAFSLEYVSYNKVGRAHPFASEDVAIAWAAYTVQKALYPEQAERLTAILEDDLRDIRAGNLARRMGRKIGEKAAVAMLKNRARDRSRDPEPQFGEGGRVGDGTTNYFGEKVNAASTNIGEWTPDPNTPEFSGDFNLSLGAFWGGVAPFALDSGDQYRLPPPPAVGSQAYNDAFAEVASVGGAPENTNTPSLSTPEKRFIGNFWGYDAVPLLGTPPRAYNQIAVQVAMQEGIDDPLELARLLAMVNVGLADSGIAAWDSKWYYNWWRPVTGIRAEDGAAGTNNDPAWDPVGVSIVNVELPSGQAFLRPTPPFPAYPSGHATFCSSMIQLLISFFGDDVAFSFTSDEYNGEGVDPFNGAPRPLVPVLYDNLSDMQIENGLSRVYNGVHWSYDNLQGQVLGTNIAQHILNDVEAFQPVDHWRPRRNKVLDRRR